MFQKACGEQDVFQQQDRHAQQKTAGQTRKHMPWKSKDYFLNGFSVKTIVLVRVYYQQILGNVMFMVFDFQGMVNTKKNLQKPFGARS